MTEKLILLNRQPKKHPLIYVLIFISITLPLLLSFFIKTYESYNTSGIIKCNEKCEILISVPYNKIDLFSNNPKLNYLHKEYKIENIVYDEPYLNNNVAYEDIKLVTDLQSEERLINFQLLYNKQRIITKLKNIIIERE